MRRGCTNADRIRGGELQKVLNPPDEASIQRFGWTFGAGDKVMQVENDYDKDVYKCDFGFVHAVDLEAGEVLVEFDGREVAYGFGELDELVLAYATTIHKSQGSEYPAVVIPLTTEHYPMLRRNLLYTGVTRAGGSWWSSVSVGQLASRFEAVSRSGAGRSSKSGSVPGNQGRRCPGEIVNLLADFATVWNELFQPSRPGLSSCLWSGSRCRRLPSVRIRAEGLASLVAGLRQQGERMAV